MSDTRAWQHVLEHVESRLLAGELAPGDRLPGERALSAELGVGRSSVREALRVLEAMGLVRTASGSGPSAGAVIVATPDGGMRTLMRLQVAARGLPVADLVDTRLLLEGAVAARLAEASAATTSGDEASAAPELGAAARLLDAMDDPTLAPEEFLALDAAFHLALAEAAGNQVTLAAMAGLRSGIEGYVVAGMQRIADWPAMAARLRTEHRGVLRSITDGDAAAARRGIHDHIAGYYAAISAPAR
ncbi:FadR/GntR family transcriptional regulator [Agromyces soli]|uniref:GntR family transcriptional regulator n=1 Tax=Agromyces soli TaxID=659012 RepID=A0ABY4AYJ6_9MICO|nr:GntR family transcriptional regulator [Agromyces soli]UOE26841.1 GntR family transcriptional regulator [Agromyces soli]